MARVSIFLITIALIAGMIGCDGDDSQKPGIRTWYDLDAVGNNLSGSYILMNDLDSTTAGYKELASPTANQGKGWQPIGTVDDLFTGTFDGQGYEIRDLFIYRPDEPCVGLFSFVYEGGVIRNIGLVDATVTGGDYVGGLVGFNTGHVSNSYFTGNVTGEYGVVGGLVGENHGPVSYSYATGSVSGNYSVGGLVGVNGLYIQGLVAQNELAVSNCYATGSVTGSSSVGSLVEITTTGSVSNSYSIGSVTGEVGVGGLVGINTGPVSNSHSTGSVTGEYGVGGLLAYNLMGSVSNSYYNYDEVLINGEKVISIGALFGEDFDQWLANDKFLDVNERFSQENGYYVVNNVSDFKQLLAFGQNAALKFRLKNDLDLATEPNFYIPCFAGEFDGNGHKISNLSFNFDFVSYVGLFGCLALGGKVTQVGVENINITGAESVGGLVGDNWEGTLSDSYATGSVTGSSHVGGLAGKNYEGDVSNSHATVSVTGNDHVGGLAGWNYGTVSNSYSSGNVTGKWNIGGLLGITIGTVSNSYFTGSVTGNWSVGGLVGANGGTVSDSYATGSVTGSSIVGGLVGTNGGNVTNSFWDMETSGQATSDGGMGKTTAEMKDIDTFSGAGWDIVTVANPGTRNPSYTWNIVNGVTYPFLSWQS